MQTQNRISLQELFRQSSSLFWQHPFLWLPVLIADVTGLTAQLLQRRLPLMAAHVFAKHSVLSSAPIPTSLFDLPLPARLLIFAAVPAVIWIKLGLYVAAMIATAVFVRSCLAGGTPTWREAGLNVRSAGLRILLYVFLVSLGIAVAVSFSAGVLSLTSRGKDVYRLPYLGAFVASSFYVGIALGTICFALMAYLFAPGAIRLLRTNPEARLSPEIVRTARIAATLTMVASGAIFIGARLVGNSVLATSSSSFAVHVVTFLQSIFCALPYVVLFIALSLLEEKDGDLFSREESLKEDSDSEVAAR